MIFRTLQQISCRCHHTRLEIALLSAISLSILIVPGLSTKSPLEVNHVIEDGFEHPNVHLGGFVLTDVFVHHTLSLFDDPSKLTHTLTQRKLKFHQNRHLINSTDGFDVFQNLTEEISSLDASSVLSRDKVRALGKLIFYNEPREFHDKLPSDDILSTYDPNELYFGADDPEELKSIYVSLWEAARREIDDITSSIEASIELYDTPNSDVSRNTIGLHCTLFSRGTDSILVFPSTSTEGDFSHVMSWVIPSIADNDSPLGATQMLKKNWLRAGLEWGQDQIDREAESDWYFRAIGPAAAFYLYQNGFGQDLADAVDGEQIGEDGDTISLTLQEAVQQGYWPIAKAVIEQVRKDLPEGGRILFTGHSLGGGIAQMARMYTEKKYQETWPVVTFGAIGAACFPRKLFGAGRTDYLDDVDPTKYYEDVTNYQVFLDMFGGGLGADVGDTCYLGKYDIANNLDESLQYKYCKEIYGYSFVRGMFDAFLGFEPLRTKFFSCNHITHDWYAYASQISRNEELNEDGTTLGGCTQYEGVPLESDQCPAINDSVFEVTRKIVQFIPALLIFASRIIFET